MTEEPDLHADLDNDLDAELTRLFADERLALGVRPDATERVLAGVRRRRQRRGAISSVACVLLTAGVLAGGATLAHQDTDRADRSGPTPTAPHRRIAPVPPPPATSTPPHTTSPPPSSTTRPNPGRREQTTDRGEAPGQLPVPTLRPTRQDAPPTIEHGTLGATLGPTGVGGLTLGMTKRAALATGLLQPDAYRTTVWGCSAYLMRDYPGPPGSSVLVSITDSGVMAFTGTDAANADGVRTGASAQSVLQRYPDATDNGHTITANVAENQAADYVFVLESGTVSQLDLALDGRPDCA